MRHGTQRRWRAAAALIGASALLLSACGGDDDDDGGDAGGGGTMVIAGSGDPIILDPAYISDGESSRVAFQIYETLVTSIEGTTEIGPKLATSWEASEDGLTWTLQLRDDVTFHDGEPFNAEAVCFNFDRWYNFTGLQQSPAVSYYWQTVFGGFADGEAGSSLYESCAATEEHTVVFTLTRPAGTFLPGLSMNSFAISSPAALEEFDADGIEGSEDDPRFTGTYGNEHPTGTGPFEFESWTRGDRVVLVRNEDYWGDGPILDELIIRPIADGPARRQALEAGEIDGYDLVDPADRDALAAAGFQVIERPAFNVGYIGFSQLHPPLDNLQIRQAIAHAINRENVIQTNYPPGSQVATQFMPPEVVGWSENVTQYDYDPDRARELIAESGVTDLTLDFWYPSDVSRPYMPNPQANFELMKADLEAVGFTVETITAPWVPDYLDANQLGEQAIHLLGWTGDYGDPDNFIGTFFKSEAGSLQFGLDEPELRAMLEAAAEETDEDARRALYEEANELVMEILPGLPYVHTSPALAFKAGVSGFVPGPLGPGNQESFATVSLSQD